MHNNHLDDTHPTRRNKDDQGDTQPIGKPPADLAATQPGQKTGQVHSGKSKSKQKKARKPEKTSTPRRYKRGRLFLAAFSLFLALVMVTVIGGWLGYWSGEREYQVDATKESRKYLEEQYALGVADMQAGNLDLARQRFEFIIIKDANFPAAEDRLIEILLIQNATATPTPLPPTITPTPTEDPRPKEELFIQAWALIGGAEWDWALETLAALRKSDPTYKMIEVDGLIFLALRNRGMDKIINHGELEGGLYDFTLAEKFGPIDVEANNYRTWARYYLMGNGFWKAYPDKAAYYYGLAASGAPYLRDASGMTAFHRYWSSLLQYADLLAKEDWCAASQQYEAALGSRADATVGVTATHAFYECLALTPSATPTPTTTFTPTITPTGTWFLFTPTFTLTSTPPMFGTPTPTNTATPTLPAITLTQTSTPTPTPTPTSTPEPSPTSTPTPTPGP